MDLQTIETRLKRIEDFLFSQKSVLTIDEVSRFTGKSKSHLYKMTCTGQIPHYKNGKHLYFDRVETENWLKQNQVKSINQIEKDASTYVTLNRNGGAR